MARYKGQSVSLLFFLGRAIAFLFLHFRCLIAGLSWGFRVRGCSLLHLLGLNDKPLSLSLVFERVFALFSTLLAWLQSSLLLSHALATKNHWFLPSFISSPSGWEKFIEGNLKAFWLWNTAKYLLEKSISFLKSQICCSTWSTINSNSSCLVPITEFRTYYICLGSCSFSSSSSANRVSS